MKKGFVYCIGQAPGGHVKIGFTTDLDRRLKLLQAGNPNELRLLGFKEGNRTVEAQIHNRFNVLRVRSEWFMDCQCAITRFFAGQSVKPPKISSDDFLDEVLAYCAERGMPVTTFGTIMVNDPNFVRNMKEGREPRWSTVSDIRKKMSVKPVVETTATVPHLGEVKAR